MENASKALIIAGAVLICIILISVGMLIVNSATEVTDQVSDTTATQAAQTFNSQFTNYAGTQRGSAVKKLLETVSTNNAVTSGTTSRQISITFTGIATEGEATPSVLSAAMSSIVNSRKYKVEMTGTDAEGFIDEIIISDLNAEEETPTRSCNGCGSTTIGFACPNGCHYWGRDCCSSAEFADAAWRMWQNGILSNKPTCSTCGASIVKY